jgi:hypothetical protein
MKITVAAGDDKKKIEKWEIEDALRTLMKAKEIESDPELFGLVKRLAKKQKSAITSIADLKSVRDMMDMEGEEPSVVEEDQCCQSEQEKKLEKQIREEN